MTESVPFIMMTLFGDQELSNDQYLELQDQVIDLVCAWEDRLGIPLIR